MRRDQLKNFSLPLKCALEADLNQGTSIIARRRALTRLATHSDTQHRQVNRRPAIQIGDSHRIAHSLFCSCCCATKRALVLAFGDVFLLLLAAIHKSVAKAKKSKKKWRRWKEGKKERCHRHIYGHASYARQLEYHRGWNTWSMSSLRLIKSSFLVGQSSSYFFVGPFSTLVDCSF